MAKLYIDCESGISGDMFIAACIDLGVDLNYLHSELRKLKLDKFLMEVETVNKKGILAKHLLIDIHDHHQERHLSDINKLIDESSLSTAVKQRAKQIFYNLGVAEAFAHETTLEEIHFHEVGAMDSIIDIIGAVICLEQLKIDEVYCSKIPIPHGTIISEHGKIPNPGPATQKLLVGFDTYKVNISKEIITPTGAAILKTIVMEQKDKTEFNILKEGIGAGTMDLEEQPNVLRLCIISSNKFS